MLAPARRLELPRFIGGTLLVIGAAACAGGDMEQTALSAPTSRAEEPAPPTYQERLASVPAAASETEAIESLLGSYCGECHASALGERLPFADGMYFVDDVAALIQHGKLLPGDAEGSRILVRILDGSMPPPGSDLPPAPPELIERLTAFIESL